MSTDAAKLSEETTWQQRARERAGREVEGGEREPGGNDEGQ